VTSEGRGGLSRAQHRKIGTDLFNYTWSLLEKKRRSAADNDKMILAAHASRYHWSRVGTARNFSIGEWQLSRVYAVLGRAEPALFHGRRALEIARRNGLGGFYTAYAYEALARAASVARQGRERDRYLREARRVGATLRDREHRQMLSDDLATIR
jgi:hypothetical protein